MVVIGGLAGDAHADERRHVREPVGERVKAVRQDAHRPRGVSEHQLGHRDQRVQDEHLNEHASDG
jgi:hypothetical protein